MNSVKFLLILFFAAIIFFSCSTTKRDHKNVAAAMHHYDRLIKNLDVKGISELFMPDGNLGNIAVGRDSIRKFLSSFKNITVLSQKSTTSSIDIIADTAIQKGTYQQSDLVGKDTVRVKGTYTADWQRVNRNWYIKKMMTNPQ